MSLTAEEEDDFEHPDNIRPGSVVEIGVIWIPVHRSISQECDRLVRRCQLNRPRKTRCISGNRVEWMTEQEFIDTCSSTNVESAEAQPLATAGNDSNPVADTSE